MGLRKLKKISLLFGLITLAALVICCDTGDKNSNRSSTPQGEHADYYKKLPSRKEFMAIQGAPLSDKFNDVYSVKVVFDLRRATIYYVNSLKYRFHYEFCQQALGNSQSLLVYNLYNYGSSGKRDYILANLNYYVSSNIYALEFASSDIIDENLVSIIFNEVERTSYVKDSLKVLISSGTLVKLDNENKLKLPKVYVSDIYKNQKYQILNAGTSYGILRKIDDIEKDYLKVTPHDIIVIKGTPVNVPVCAGIITDIYQTPLSHINVLCHNRNIPSAVMIDAWNSDKMDKFSGKPVMITVNNDSMHIELSTKEAVDIFWKKRVPKNKVVLRANLSVKHLLPLKDFNTRTKDVVGNKAAGLGELAKIAKKENGIFSVPEGAFAVPFYFYHEHVSDPKIQKEIYE